VRENRIEKAVSEYAQNRHVMSLKLESPGRKGIPDRLFIFRNGVMCFAEFKKIDTTTTRLQDYMLAQLQERGCKTYVIHGIQEGIAVINENLAAAASLSTEGSRLYTGDETMRPVPRYGSRQNGHNSYGSCETAGRKEDIESSCNRPVKGCT